MKKIVVMILGVLLVLAGIVLLVLPGPGLLLIGTGGWMILSQLRKPKHGNTTPSRQPTVPP